MIQQSSDASIVGSTASRDVRVFLEASGPDVGMRAVSRVPFADEPEPVRNGRIDPRRPRVTNRSSPRAPHRALLCAIGLIEAVHEGETERCGTHPFHCARNLALGQRVKSARCFIACGLIGTLRGAA